ncbi:MAG: DUF1553 domain-containing protein [Verrucomicrobiae bacterium]|nr:DUF1553 domain-containing protein [Verrucomicrobiae bacterium]
MTHRPRIAAILLTWLTLRAFSGIADAAETDFNRDIRPLLSDRCFHCHGPDAGNRKARLRLDRRTDALSANAFVPGKPDESELLKRVLTSDAGEIMPPPETNKPLTDKEKRLLRAWIAEGGEYKEHWAFVPPTKPELKTAAGANEIDTFIDLTLKQHGLKRSPESRRETLIRRATLDLTGLPPSPAEVDAFLSDKSPNAYEKVLDRLLASERFGERMALYWMDAARYGDSSVMHADGPRDMWPWRDYVINAFNNNMPFDRFTVEQIAGDLLPDATTNQKVASGFNRNHATSDEGGAIAEELRVEYVIDRVMTTSTVWLALTMECSQCHDHKYDPITQKDYYSFYAFFNNTTDPGMQTRKGNQSPVVEVPSEDQEKALIEARAKLASASKAFDEHRRAQTPKAIEWLESFREGGIPEPAGLVLHIPFETNSAALVSEIVSGKEAKTVGQTRSIERENGDTAFAFDGKTHLELDRKPGVEFDKPFTFAAWIKSDGKGSSAIFSKMDTRKDFRGFDFWQQGRNVGTHIINKWPDNALKVVSKDAFPVNKWTHLVVSYDGSRKQQGIKIYIDGKLSDNKVEKDALKSTVATDAPFRVATRGDSATFKGELDDLRLYERELSTTELARLGANELGKALAKTPPKRNAKEKKLLEDYYFETQDADYPALLATRDSARREESALKAKITTCMIMQDNTGSPRMTYLLERGQYNKPVTNDVILANIPAALGSLPEGTPSNRLGLARWLTSRDNPLTARVAINRLWGLFFGEGIVSSQGDFGNQGSVPTHPELLDWLAVDFMEHGWDVKRAVKQMLMSATYRQTSRATDRLLRDDPENRLYARGPRFRLQGEFIRDQALSIAGLLNGPVGGPGVKPYQPPNIWNEVSLSGNVRYVPDKEDKLYRRSMYTYWKRSAPMPNMLIFDAPTREKCVVKRPRTNTPLQALVTLNDPQFVEAARAFAQRILLSGSATVDERIQLAFRLAVSRPANSREIDVLTTTLQEQAAQFRADPERAKQFLGFGESKRDESIDPAEHAAWTVITQLILNLDETLTRG